MLLSVLMTATAAFGDDSGLFVSPENAAVRARKSPEMLFVDIRSPADFEAISIPGAVNIPLYAVKTKTFLKKKMMVLVNNGFCKRQLTESCRKLKAMDFDPRILNGGLNAWIEKDLPVRGTFFACKAVCRVSPREAFQEKFAQSFLPVNISGKPQTKVFKRTRFLDPSESGSLSVLTRYNHSHRTGTILVFNRAGTGYSGLKKKLAAAGIENVFFLKGGWRGYEAYLDGLDRCRAPKARRIKTVNKTGCKSCGD